MESQNVTLQKDEQVVLEQDGAVLTDRRILSRRSGSGAAAVWDEAIIKDVLTIKTVSGGQESRVDPGLKSAAVGALVATAGALVDSFTDQGTVGGGAFIIGLIIFMAGVYLILSSVLRVKPHTSVFFVIPGRKDIRVSFAGRENARADDLTRAFARVIMAPLTGKTSPGARSGRS